jgi:site-specific recombinase XerD
VGVWRSAAHLVTVNTMATLPVNMPSALGISSLLQSWEIELTALRRSPATLTIYLTSVKRYFQWVAEKGHEPVVDRRLVQAWIAELLTNGAAPATAAARLASIRQLSKWMAAEGFIEVDPLLGLNAPKGDVPLTPVLTEDELKALAKACQGPQLRDRRDEAIVRLFAETGMRAGELLALKMDDVDVVRGAAIIRRGKGGKARVAVFGAVTARALDRYLRLRRTHPASGSPFIWLGARTGGPLGAHGLRVALKERAERAGVANFHPHVLRHTFASRFLAAGGREGNLMSLAGWSDRSMLDRYGRAAAADRATTEARSLDLGNF